MDKHKFERFLHPGRFVIASIFAPISFPPLPLLVFKEATPGDRRGAAGAATLVASGSLRSVDPDRIVLKKITLSGYLFIQLSPTSPKPHQIEDILIRVLLGVLLIYIVCYFLWRLKIRV
jgi:hypothetical protein